MKKIFALLSVLLLALSCSAKVADSKLEQNTWSVRIGPNIGGPVPFVAPTSFTITPPSTTSPWQEVSITGSGYTDGMSALQRPWLPTAGFVSLSFNIVTDSNAPTTAQAIETDIRFCDPAGYNYNGSFQINYEQGGEIQVYGVSPNPAWTNTGLFPGKFAPGTIVPVRINYAIDTTKHTLSIVSAIIGGVTYVVPTALRNVPADLLNWGPGNYIQMQLDEAYAGGTFSVWFKDITISFPGE